MNKKLWTAVLIALLIANCKGKSGASTYQTQKVDRGAVTMTVTATGIISAVTTVAVGSQVSGVISHLYVDFKSRVKKGQLLCDIDPTPFQQVVDQRRADVLKAQVEMANTKITYSREARLLAEGLAAQADVDTAKAAYDSARADYAQAQATMQQALTNLGYTKIVSPIDGIVVDREFDVGQTVAASFQAPLIFSIAQDLTKMQVEADVDQSDIGRVQVGQVASFTVDAYPDQVFKGTISQIRLNATVSQNVVTYPVMIGVANPDERLLPKMTADVSIDVAQVKNVLRIPNAALRFKPPNAKPETTAPASASTATPVGVSPAQTGQAGAAGAHQHQRGGGLAGAAGALSTKPRVAKSQTVYVLDPATDQLRAVTIKTGITDGHYTAVISGDLKEGDLVIVGTTTTKVTPTSSNTNNPMAPSRGPRGR